MTLKAALYSYLSGHAGLTALIGERLYPSTAPPGAPLPRITFQRISEASERHQTAAAGLAISRVQFDCWGRSTVEVEDVAEQLRQALETYRGDMGGLTVRYAMIESTIDQYEPPEDAGERGIHRVTSDYAIWHEQTIPTPNA